MSEEHVESKQRKGTGTDEEKKTMSSKDTLISSLTKGPNRISKSVVLPNGTVASWGRHLRCIQGLPRDESKNIIKICSTNKSFLALSDDGSIYTWGTTGRERGDDEMEKINKMRRMENIKVKDIYSSTNSFMALMDNKQIFIWGNKVNEERRSTLINAQIFHMSFIDVVKSVVSSDTEFAITGANGYMFICGGRKQGPYMRGVDKVFASQTGFAALLKNKSVIIPSTHKFITDVKSLCSNSGAFSALRNNGDLVSWGYTGYGGIDHKSNDIVTRRIGSRDSIESIHSTSEAFTVLLKSGSTKSWGNSSYGGDDSKIINILENNVERIQTTKWAFVAHLKDGRVVIWGGRNHTEPYIGDKPAERVIIDNDSSIAVCYPGYVYYWRRSGAPDKRGKYTLPPGRHLLGIVDNSLVLDSWSVVELDTKPSLGGSDQYLSFMTSISNDILNSKALQERIVKRIPWETTGTPVEQVFADESLLELIQSLLGGTVAGFRGDTR